MNDTTGVKRRLWAADLGIAVLCVCAAFVAWDHVGPVGRRCENCAADLAAYRKLAETFGAVDDAHYHSQVSAIFFGYGLREDAERERRRAEALSQRGAER